ncbi:Hypp6932 [Branchiostoma lanceolatum]|uniref:Hypp6932 protein n=1 Tax=Branchiostoma lanceolatum TaxID=7740 RepID=A0A8J9YVX1_BRALA|nr:Hypp6932 [Branchiostoma lanceolatum]
MMDSKVMEKRKWPALKLAVLVVVLSAIVQLTDEQRKDEESLLGSIESNKEDIEVSTDEERGEDRYFDGK